MDSVALALTKCWRVAPRPFCYRILVPVVADWAAQQLPDWLVQRHRTRLLTTSPLLRYEKDQMEAAGNWSLETSVRYHMTYVLVFGSLVALLVLMRQLAIDFFQPLPFARDFGPPLLLMLLPLTFHNSGFIYDFPELMLMFACLVALVRGWWLAYYLLLLLAMLNKESSILYIAFFVAYWFRRMNNRTFAVHLMAQALLVGCIYLALKYKFAGNPGADMEMHLATNLRFLASPKSYFLFFDPYAPLILTPQGFNFLTLSFLAWASAYRWVQKPLVLRRLLILTVVVITPFYLAGGFHDEIRALSLTFPALYLMAFHSLFVAVESQLPTCDG